MLGRRRIHRVGEWRFVLVGPDRAVVVEVIVPICVSLTGDLSGQQETKTQLTAHLE